MARNGNNKVREPSQGEQAWQSDASWQCWPGSWRSRQQRGQGQNQDKQAAQGAWKDAKFPSYSTMPVSDCTGDRQQKDTPSIEDEGQQHGADLLKAIQQVNRNNRRLEARLRKVAGDLHQKHAQWEAFQKEMQATFCQERQSYKTDVYNLERELAEVRQSKGAALRQLLDLTDSDKVARGSMNRPAAMEVTPDGKQAWESLIAGAQEPQDEFADDDLP